MNLRDPEAVLVGHVRPAAAPAARVQTARVGVLYGLAAYGLWGVFPVYFKAVQQVPPLEVLCHRIIWALAFLLLLMLWRRDWGAARVALRCRRTMVTLCATTLLIGSNWLVFIWAVANNHVLEASLGYFINPLVNVLLGVTILRERLRTWQMVSVGLAAIGVGYLTISGGHFPALALFLAGTFGSYGLLRKVVGVDALTGLTVETALLTPLAIAFLGYHMMHGWAVFGGESLRMNLLLPAAGVVTAAPLLWFTEAARRLRLATMGFLQYISPSGYFLLAVLAYGEPLTRAHVVTFACIWTALAIYSIDTALRARAAAATVPTME